MSLAWWPSKIQEVLSDRVLDIALATTGFVRVRLGSDGQRVEGIPDRQMLAARDEKRRVLQQQRADLDSLPGEGARTEEQKALQPLLSELLR